MLINYLNIFSFFIPFKSFIGLCLLRKKQNGIVSFSEKVKKKNGIVSFGVKMSRPAFFYRGDYFKMKYGAK